MSKIKKLAKKIPISRNIYKKLFNYYQYLEFKKEFNRFKSLSSDSDRFTMSWKESKPCLSDKTSTTIYDRHYIYHTAWAARVLASTRPEEHVDISSCIYFVTLVSAFIPIKFYDWRPPVINLSGLQSNSVNLIFLPFPDASIPSLSCMHVIEHIGLRRYGDPIDPDGDLKAIAELKRVLASGGDLLFVVPIGQPKLIFNAHRIYSYDQIIMYFKELNLLDFALIPDNPEDGGLIESADKKMADAQTYGCGCFWFRK